MLELPDEARRLALFHEEKKQYSRTTHVLLGLADEVERLKRGDFTPEEFQTLCHNRQDSLAPVIFNAGCEHYQQKLFGYSPITVMRTEIGQLLNEKLALLKGTRLLEGRLEAAEQHVTICQRMNTEEVERRRKAEVEVKRLESILRNIEVA